MDERALERNCMFRKVPGDWAIHHIEKMMYSMDGVSFVTVRWGDYFKAGLEDGVERLQLKKISWDKPLNLVFDFTEIDSSAEVTLPIIKSIIDDHVLHGRALPKASAIVCIVMDEQLQLEGIKAIATSCRFVENLYLETLESVEQSIRSLRAVEA